MRILVKADLIDTTKKLGIPEFSGDGEYLTHYTAAELIKSLGKPEDDVSNTFTARLLLLLESTPLLGDAVYTELTQDVITAYWRDYEDHKNDLCRPFWPTMSPNVAHFLRELRSAHYNGTPSEEGQTQTGRTTSSSTADC